MRTGHDSAVTVARTAKPRTLAQGEAVGMGGILLTRRPASARSAGLDAGRLLRSQGFQKRKAVCVFGIPFNSPSDPLQAKAAGRKARPSWLGGDGASQLEPFQAILEAFRMLSGTLAVR